MKFIKSIWMYLLCGLIGVLLLIGAETPAQEQGSNLIVERNYLPEPIRIFSKWMLNSYKADPFVQETAIEDGLKSVEKFVQLPPKNVKVSSLKEYLKIRYADKARYTYLDLEIPHLREGKGLVKYQFDISDGEVKKAIHQYHLNQKAMARKLFADNIEDVDFRQFVQDSDPGVKEEKARQLKKLASKMMEDAMKLLVDSEDPTTEMSKSGQRDSFLLLGMMLKSNPQMALMLREMFYQAFEKMEKEIRSIGDKIVFDGKESLEASLDEDKAEERSAQKVKDAKGMEGLNRFIRLVIGGVYRHMSIDGVRRAISGTLDHPDQRNDLERFSHLLKFSIPQFLKLIQLVAEEPTFGKKLKGVFTQIESSGLAAPAALVEEVIEAHRENLRLQGIEIISWNPKALNAGTIAQIHLAQIRVTKPDGTFDQFEAVLRLPKPGIHANIAEGEIVMAKVAVDVDSDPELRKLRFVKLATKVPMLTRNIYRDTEIKGGSERQIEAKDHYTETHNMKYTSDWGEEVLLRVHFRVPKVYGYSDGIEGQPGIMVMEKVSGEKLKEIKKTSPRLAKAFAYLATNLWVEKAFFTKAGFLHADLHQGNFMVKIMDALENIDVSVLKNDKDGRPIVEIDAPILDFGMADQTEVARRSVFIGIAIAAKLEDARLMKTMLWGLADKEHTVISEAELIDLINEKMLESKALPKLDKIKPHQWVSWATDMGIVLPNEFVNLSRGTGIALLLASRYKLVNGFSSLMLQTVKKTFRDKPIHILDMLFRGLIPKWETTKAVGRKLNVFSSSQCVRSVKK